MPYKDKTGVPAKESLARRNKRYYEKNKEEIKEYKKIQQAQYKKDYYEKNREKMLKQTTVARRLRMFGVTEDEYNELFTKQSGKCAICGKHQSDLNHTLCVDHCHETGKIRGLLCHDCNVGIGRLKDSLKNLRNAIKYLK